MKSPFVLIGAVFILSLPPVRAEESEEMMYQKADSQATGVILDIPQDMRLVKIANGVHEVETPDHYMSRKMDEQNKKIDVLQKEREGLTARLAVAEEKIRQLEIEMGVLNKILRKRK